MTRLIGAALLAAAVALAGLGTTWRTDHASAGTSTTVGFAELPVVGVVLFGVGVVLLGLARWTPLLGLAATSLLIAALTGVSGVVVDGDDSAAGPAPWLFVGGCLTAAVLAWSARRPPGAPEVRPSLALPSAPNRVRRALTPDDGHGPGPSS